jgi:FAD dependent oxidoreductase
MDDNNRSMRCRPVIAAATGIPTLPYTTAAISSSSLPLSLPRFRPIRLGLVLLSVFSTTLRLPGSQHSTPWLPFVAGMKIVVIGGGIQGTSVAYHLAQLRRHDVTILEAIGPASAASGKGGGFMARSWGDGTPTQQLHELAFDLYEEMAVELSCESYRKLPVLSVTPGYSNGVAQARKDKTLQDLLPSWLDGKNVGRIKAMGNGDDTAQITPAEFVTKMLAAQPSITLVSGTCTGFDTTDPGPQGRRKVTGVYYTSSNSTTAATTDTTDGGLLLAADAVVVSAGPWSCQAEDWIQRACGVAIQLPMEGVKSASIVWEAQEDVDATALFCGEDDRFGTHCK